MVVQRKGRPLIKGFGDDGSSSDSDNDAFSSISKKKKPRLASIGSVADDGANGDVESTGETSSNKRHHHVNAARQAKMDALLQELKTAKPSELPHRGGRDDSYYGSIHDGENDFHGYGDRFAPQKKGSYVEPGMEHLTTNLFVGNLDPMTTEEELTDCFRQFGDLYSVKIMWPRTAEERARNRNTGFVCFMHRADAEDAMDELCEADPLGTGRRMILRWGKNVKKTGVAKGTGVPTNLRKKPRENQEAKRGPTNANFYDATGSLSNEESHRSSAHVTASITQYSKEDIKTTTSSMKPSPPDKSVASKSSEQKIRQHGPIYDPSQHSAEAIIVTAPTDPRRLKFITTVASFVAKDGSILEKKLIETQSFNSDFLFLTPRDCSPNSPISSDDDNERFTEHIFYRWRVYSFAQGDGFNSWRTDPFVMFEPHGRFWIPPPLNTLAAQEEEEAEKRQEHSRLAAQEERRKMAGKKQDCIMTGAQLRRTNMDKFCSLNEWEKKVFYELLREKLCASQESICEAMAFCFDKSGAAKEISELLRAAMLESDNGISVDTRITRLFLLSDILFNSQQPGVRNAFYYRDAIEAMSPDVFESLGNHGGGRMTKNKLRKAVSSVLSAWTNWSVYNFTFIDELESKFEGREISVASKLNEDLKENEDEKEAEVTPNTDGADKEELAASVKDLAAVSTTPRGTWTSAKSIDAQDTEPQDVDGEGINRDNIDGEAIDEDVDGEAVHDSDLDGEELDEDIDGEELDGDVDGEELEDDVDGEALEGCSL